MPLTAFPSGVSSYGVPQVGDGLSIPQLPQGQAWYVDADLGTNGGGPEHGGSPTSAFSSIQSAVNVASSGDTIFVFPGSYNENVVVTTDYVSIVGALAGRYGWPDIVPDSGIPVTVTAQGFTARNLRVAATATDCWLQQGNGFSLDSIVFDGDGTSAKAGLRLVGVAADDSFTASEGFVTNSIFRGNSLGLVFDTAAAPTGVGSTDNVIAGNRFYANTQDIVTKDSGTGTYSVQRVLIAGNSFEDKNKTNYINLTTANGGAASDQTGAINGNTFAADSITTTNVAMIGTGFTFAGNYDTVGIVDGSGLD